MSLRQSFFIGFGFSSARNHLEDLAKIVNGFDTLNRLLLLQKAQSKMLVGFLNLPRLMNHLQHKHL